MLPPKRAGVNQRAGDHATQIGVVGRDVHIYQYYSKPDTGGTTSIDFPSYNRAQLEHLQAHGSRYAMLDAEPLVAVLGQGLRAVGSAAEPITAALSIRNRIVMLGSAGAGKSATLNYLAYTTAASTINAASSDAGLPFGACILVDLARFRAPDGLSPIECILALIGETLYVHCGTATLPSLSTVHNALADSRLLLLFDGLNEVEYSLRARCARAIQDFAIRFPLQHLVVATRWHGYSPWERWEAIAIRELRSSQVAAIVRGHVADESADGLISLLKQVRNPLLRLPLFVTYASELWKSRIPDLESRLRSRSALIASYVDFVLERRTSKNTDVPPEMDSANSRRVLRRLAEVLQATGQAVPIVHAQESAARALSSSSNPTEGRRALDELCERGLVLEERGYVRFWHHTIQEHFFSEGVAEKWRESSGDFGRTPARVGIVLASSANADALASLIACVPPAGAWQVLRAGFAFCPGVALGWLDDLLEQYGSSSASARAITKLRLNSRALRLHSMWGNTRFRAIRAIAFQGSVFALPLLSIGIGFGHSELGWAWFLVVVSLGLGALFWAFWAVWDVGKHYLGLPRSEEILSAIRYIRNDVLRRELLEQASVLAKSRRANADIVILAQAVCGIATHASWASTLRDTEAPFTTIRLLGYATDPIALPILVEVLRINNAYSIAASEALKRRWRRFPDERDQIVEVCERMWSDEDALPECRAAASVILRSSERSAHGAWKMQARIAASRLLGLICVAGSLFVIGAGLATASGTFYTLSFWTGSIAGALAWLDARRLRADPINAYSGFDSLRPFAYGVAIFVAPLLAVLYLTRRTRIRANAKQVDWTQIVRNAGADSALLEPDDQARSLAPLPVAVT